MAPVHEVIAKGTRVRIAAKSSAFMGRETVVQYHRKHRFFTHGVVINKAVYWFGVHELEAV